MTKKDLRQQIRAAIGAIPPDQSQVRSAAAVWRLCAEPEYRNARVVMIFLSTRQEVDTTILAQQAWRDGKRVAAPRINWDDCGMIPTEISSLSADVLDGQFGIREPVAGSEIAVGGLDLLIVPGVAFDLLGRRLGRGRGFYDRFMAQPGFRAVACGLAFEEQVVEAVPYESHDACMDMLVTDAAVRRFAAARNQSSGG